MIVNRKLAEHYWPNQDPIGKRMRIGTPEMKTPWLTIVGEVADVKLSFPGRSHEGSSFTIPVDQAEEAIGSLASPGDLNGNGGYHRVALGVAAGADGKRSSRYRASIDPQLPLTQVQTMEQAVSESEAPRRFNTVLITSFAFAAVLLAVLGIYSVIAFSVASRVQEMAIRMALGSQRSGIIRPDSGVRRETCRHRLRAWVGGSCRGLQPAALAALRSEPVRPAGADAGRGRRAAAGAGRIYVSRAPCRLH